MTEPNEIDKMPAGSGGDRPDEPDEFRGLAPAGPARSPILPLSIIGLCAVTLVHLRGDLRYAFSSRSAVPIEQLRGAGEDPVGRYVQVHGVPDRRNSLYVEARGEKARESFFRLLDSDPPLFVRARDTAGRSDLPASWRGRLRRFGDVAYASSLRDYFARGAQATHYLDPTSLRARLEQGRGPVRDRMGKPIELGPDTVLEAVGGLHRYAIFMSRDKYANREDAARELRRLLGEVDPSLSAQLVAAEDAPDAFVFTLPMLSGDGKPTALLIPKAVAARLEDRGIDFAGWPDRLEAPLSALRLDGTRLVASAAAGKPERALPFEELSSVAFHEPLKVADDALVLTEGESPAGFIWAPLVAALLLALAAFNVWYLLRPRRPA